MVPDTRDVEALLAAPDGILTGAHNRLTVVAMGTYQPAAMSRFAELLATRGSSFLDAPVSGGDVAARSGTLAIMVGGKRATFTRARPVLAAMGTPTYVGGIGAGQVAKACNQLIVGSTIQAVAEALVLAKAAGADPERVRLALLNGFAASRVLDLHGRRMLERNYAPGARAALHAKDAAIVLDLAAEVGVNLAGFAPAAAALQELVERGLGDRDHSVLFEIVQQEARH
jgi:2-hydroxy-3-oxopropionate reductase